MSYGVNDRTTMASKVLGFLVESGLLYILIGVSFISENKARPASHHKTFPGLRLGLCLRPPELCDTRRHIGARGRTTRGAYRSSY
jgi:hypothetical protein